MYYYYYYYMFLGYFVVVVCFWVVCFFVAVVVGVFVWVFLISPAACEHTRISSTITSHKMHGHNNIEANEANA